MNDTNKLLQIQNILFVLEEQKKKDIAEIDRIKLLQQKRIESVNKISAYKTEYERKNIEGVSSTIPALYRNYEIFMKKLDDAIRSETIVVEQYEHQKIEKLQKLEQLELKVQAIRSKLNKIELQISSNVDIAETIEFNELSIQKKIREQT